MKLEIKRMSGQGYVLLLYILATMAAVSGNAQGIGSFNADAFRAQYDEGYRKTQEIHPVVFQSGGKYGIKDSISGEVILKPKYDTISDFTNGFAIFTLKGKKGVLYDSGKKYIKPKYAEIIMPPAECMSSFPTPAFIVSEKENGPYRLISKNAKGDLFSRIGISPQGECFGEISEGTWMSISTSTFKSTGNTLKATREEMTIRKLSDKYFLFNNGIYSYEKVNEKYGPPMRTRMEMHKIEGNKDSKEIRLSGIPFLFTGNSLIDLSSFPEYNSYIKLFALDKNLKSSDGIYVANEKSGNYNNDIDVLLAKDENLYHLVLSEFYNKFRTDGEDGVREIITKWKGLIVLKDIGSDKMGLWGGGKIIIPATFSDIRLDRLQKGDNVFILCRALDDTKPGLSETYDNVYQTLRKIAGDNIGLYVRTPDMSRLYGWSDRPIDVARADELRIENGIIWSCDSVNGDNAYSTDGKLLLSGISDHGALNDKLHMIVSGKVGVVRYSDGNLTTVLPMEYDRVSKNDKLVCLSTYEGGAPTIYFEKDGKEGVMTEDGTIMLPCKYDKIDKLYQLIQDVKPLIIRVVENGKTGLVGTDGRQILPCEYAGITSTYNDNDCSTIILAKDFQGKTTICDMTGKALGSKVDFDSFGVDGRVYKNGKMGFIDPDTKKLIIPCIYDRDALEGGMYGAGSGKNRRIALGRENGNGTATVDIWTFAGKKLASKTFPSNARYRMASFIEQWLGIQVGW